MLRQAKSLTQEELAARTLVGMVTTAPAKAFRIQKETGSLAEGKLADIIVIRDAAGDPYESLVNIRTQDIELLVREGTPILGAAAHEELFAGRGVQYTKVRVQGREMLVSGDPAALLEGVRAAVGFRKVLDFMPLDS